MIVNLIRSSVTAFRQLHLLTSPRHPFCFAHRGAEGVAKMDCQSPHDNPNAQFPLSQEYAMFRRETNFSAKRFQILPAATRATGVFSSLEAQFLGMASPGILTLRDAVDGADSQPMTPFEDNFPSRRHDHP